MTSDMPPVGVIAGRYRIERRLGRGGMGSVWRAEHLQLHSPVAVKLIDRALAESEEARARFLREAQSAAMLRSPHVVQILDHGIDHGVPYIAMELLEGESLAERIARGGKLTPQHIGRIMMHVARAMSRAHAAGIVHRDLKPDNVFLVQNDDEEIAKVLDFGIAKADATLSVPSTSTRAGAVMGSPHYMAPEQVEASEQLDHRADLWAMAVMTFECITGVKPFDSSTLGGVLLHICAKPIPVPSSLTNVPPGFDAWFQRATQREPDLRFQSAKELSEALRVVVGLSGNAETAAVRLDLSAMQLRMPVAGFDTPARGRVSSASVSSIPGVRRMRWLWPLVAAASAVIVGAAAYQLGSRGSPQASAALQGHVVTPAPREATPKAFDSEVAAPSIAAAQGSLNAIPALDPALDPATAPRGDLLRGILPEEAPAKPAAKRALANKRPHAAPRRAAASSAAPSHTDLGF
jgi:serine/threonine-protein kinase